MQASFDKIRDELSVIDLEVVHLTTFLAGVNLSVLTPGSQQAWETILVCASASVNIYSGIERIMSLIAADIDLAPLEEKAWHKALLQRMANPYASVRPAAISGQCHDALDNLRSYRHRVRNLLGVNWKIEIVLERGPQAVAAFRLFEADILTLLRAFTKS